MVSKKKLTKKQRCRETGKGNERCVLFLGHRGNHLDRNGRAWVRVRTK